MPAGSKACWWGELPYELPMQVCTFNLIYSCKNKPRKNAGMSLTTRETSGLICNLVPCTHAGGAFSPTASWGEGPGFSGGVSCGNFYYSLIL